MGGMSLCHTCLVSLRLFRDLLSAHILQKLKPHSVFESALPSHAFFVWSA